MSYLHRVTPNKATSQNIEAIYNEKGQMLDANTKEVLVQGQIDKGHKHGYEEQAMRACAERCHMTQKEYNKMMQNPKLYQFEFSHNNRSHKFESKDRMEQLHKCFEVIRDYKGKNRNKAHDKYGKSDFTFSNKSKTPNLGRSLTISGKSQSSHSNHGTVSSKSSIHGNSTTGSHGSSLSGGLTGGHSGIGSSGSIGGHVGSSGHGGGHGSGSSGGGHGGHGGTGGGHGR